jgi:hypothetical protein
MERGSIQDWWGGTWLVRVQPLGEAADRGFLMVPANMKWIAEQVLEGKGLLNIDFGETGLNSDEKLALIGLALTQIPCLPSKPESEIIATREEQETILHNTSESDIPRLIIYPFTQKQNQFLPLEVKNCEKFGGLLRTEFRVTQRARLCIQGNSSGIIKVVRQGWKNTLALALREA